MQRERARNITEQNQSISTGGKPTSIVESKLNFVF